MSRGKGCPRILKLFGEDLKIWLYADPGSWNVLPLAYATWIAGGCWILARALHEWIGPGSSLWSIHDGGLLQHVVVRVGDCYLDGDGASTREELLKRWRKEELLEDPVLKEFKIEEAGAIECPAAPAKELRDKLARIFGPGENVLDWARGE